jgi:hypothetical protein
MTERHDEKAVDKMKCSRYTVIAPWKKVAENRVKRRKKF